MKKSFFKQKSTVLRLSQHFLYWIFILFFFTLLPSLYSQSVKQVFLNNLLYLPIDISATYFVLYILFPKFLENKKTQFTIGLASIFLIVIIISFLVRKHIEPYLNFYTDDRPFSMQVLYSVLIFSTIIGPALFLKYNNFYKQLNNKKLELEKQNYQSEIKLLKSQINPHFLFNTLNNIDELIYQNHEKASDAIILLSENMRYMLNNSSIDKISLGKELNFIKDYINLSKLSFKDQGFIKFSQKGYSGSLLIEPLLLLPIIENAIKHSNKNVSAPGITIAIEILDETIELTTTNKLQTFKSKEPTKGFGLSNLKRRLELLYFGKFEFSTKETGQVFQSYLKIDLN